jgi:serine protease Do
MATRNTKSYKKMSGKISFWRGYFQTTPIRFLPLPLCRFVFFVAICLGSAEDAPQVTAELSAVRAAEAARVRAIASVTGSVVAIYGNDRQGGGSGVVFDPAGYALTNHHVISAAGKAGWAGLADGKLYRWKLIGTDPGGDLAIIQLTGREQFPAAPLGNSDEVRVGDWALAMGNPFALAEDQQPSISLGIVSGVNRFQEGAGLNQLVYGNCIQVDSSINPGNSGGPLFNIRGQIVGINGRGSFEERGRVNVGLGYAISSNQVLTFLPELLATKIAQHGTLDAMFGNRTEGVICVALNLDAPAAKAGLALGDKLVAFEGIPIHNANQFTSLVSTYPAGWPADVTFEHEGQRKPIRVRLSALPYERFVPVVKPPEEPADEPRPDNEPKPTPPPASPERPEFPLHDAGKFRDSQLNREIAQQLIMRWRKTAGRLDDDFTTKSQIRRGEAIVGWQALTISRGGSIRVRYEIDGQQTVVEYDGNDCWKTNLNGVKQKVERSKALLDPHFAQSVVLSALQEDAAIGHWGELALDGADKAGGRLCYRLSITDPATSERLFIWLSVLGADGQPRVELVKTGVGLDDDEPIASTLYADLRTGAGVLMPQRRTLVQRLAEVPLLETFASAHGGEFPDRPSPKPALDGPFSSAIELAQRRTVKIFGAGIGRSAGYASGVIVGPDGQILTAQGVFLGAATLRVTLADGTTHDAAIIRRSSDLQAALLKIEAPTPDYFDLSQQPAVEPGDWLLAVSNAFKVAEGPEPLSVNVGVLTLRMPIDARRGVHDFPYHADAYVYDAVTSNPGAEGGAVVTAGAQLVGMIGRVIESKSSGTRLNYAVPADLLAKFVAGDTSPPVAAAAIPSTKADLGIRLFALGGRRGPAYVDRVVPGGPAASAGLQSDDLVVSIAGQAVRDASDFRRIVESLTVGVEVVVEVKRKNELINVRLKPVSEK